MAKLTEYVNDYFISNQLASGERLKQLETTEAKRKEEVNNLQATISTHISVEEFYYKRCCELREENQKLKDENQELKEEIEKLRKAIKSLNIKNTQ